MVIPPRAQFDVLVSDGDQLQAGVFGLQALATPGHTPACTSYLVRDMVFTGGGAPAGNPGTSQSDSAAGVVGEATSLKPEGIPFSPPAAFFRPRTSPPTPSTSCPAAFFWAGG